MKANELVTLWGAPEPQRLTQKQLTIRLPMLVSAKISALCDLYPKKTKTDVIGDLLILALDQLEDALPKWKGEQTGEGPDGRGIFQAIGMIKNYYNLTEKHLRELEKEAGVTEPMEFITSTNFYEDSFKTKD